MAKAKFRMVHTAFWNDPTVSEEMTPEDKYFFLYLLTNEHTTQIGIYGISKKQMAFDTGYSIESINALMQRFIDHHKLIQYNAETREIAIKNWGKYNFNKGGKPVLDCVKSELQHVKDYTLIPYVTDSILNEPVKAIYDTWYESLTNRGTTRGQEEEKEEEEEEQEEQEEEQESAPVAVVNPFMFYQENGFGILSSITQQKIQGWCDDLSDELVIHAMQTAIESNKVSWSYAEGILRKWASRNVKTIQDVEALKAQFTANKSYQQNGKGNSRTENVPEWFGKHQLEKQHKPPVNNEPIDFEAERAKVLAKLGGDGA